jgi:uncharacterized protein
MHAPEPLASSPRPSCPPLDAAPDGEPLTLAHRVEIEALLAACRTVDEPEHQRLSDPWFANLYLFRAAHAWRFRRGAHPCITGHAYDGSRVVIPLFDLAAAPASGLRGLLEGHDAFAPLGEAQASRLDPARFVTHAGRDDADYLYPAENFLHYRGSALHKKRNLVSQLHAAHTPVAVPLTDALADEAQAVLDGWMQAKRKAPGETDDVACREALALCRTLGLHGHLHRIGGVPVGFVLAQRIGPRVDVVRFAKGVDGYNGLYQHMFQHHCQAAPELRWLNFEQDLGLANFRRTKMSYRPVALLAKYRVTLRDA